MPKPKLLWMGDVVSKTGYARVTEAILSRLEDYYDIAVLAVNYWGDTCAQQHRWRLYPATAHSSGDAYGYGRLSEVMEVEQPAVMIGLGSVETNARWGNISETLRLAHQVPMLGYMPVDGSGGFETYFRGLSSLDMLITYSPTAAAAIQQATGREVEVIPHGLDPSQFRPLGDRAEWKATIRANPDDFIVFNGNRNQTRKRIDITIKAFARFAATRPNARLYLHMGIKDHGWDIVALFNREMRRHGLSPEGRLLLTALTMEPHQNPTGIGRLNEIYNACDVGINTCQGGGWELVSFEHAATRTPQLVPAAHPFLDIYGTEPGYCYAEVGSWLTDPESGIERGVVSEDSVVEQLERLYDDRDYYRCCAERAYAATHLPDYSWDSIAIRFDQLIHRAIAAKQVWKPHTRHL